MKIKFILAIVVLSFIKAHTCQGQCPVVTYEIVNVSKNEYWNYEAKEFNKGLKMLMKDSLKSYNFNIKYMSIDNKILNIGRADSYKYQDDLYPVSGWHNTSEDSTLGTWFEFESMKYNIVPLNTEWLAKSSYISIDLGEKPYWSKDKFPIEKILCSLKIDLKVNAVLEEATLVSNIYVGTNEIVINLKDENIKSIKASLINSVGVAREMDILPEGSGKYIIKHQHITQGIYSLRLLASDQLVVTKKIILE